MPYVRESRRDKILVKKPTPLGWTKMLVLNEISNAGELNYAVTELVLHFFKKNSPQNYQAINDVSGALTEALAEFRRRIIIPYEEDKIEENGDVYPSSEE